MTEPDDTSARPEDDGNEHAPAVGIDGDSVFIPSEPMKPDDEQANVELRETTEGALALVSFTSLDRLVEGCGEHQAWISVPRAEVQRLAEQVGAQVILQDVPLPHEQRHDAPNAEGLGT